MLADLNAADDDAAARLLEPCCASSRWVNAVLDGRPYNGLPGLVATSDSALGAMSWSDVQEALAAHPRIGERADGTDREAAWSRQEQSGTATVTATTQEQLREGNLTYEQQFGYVFLICATGLSAEQMLAALRERLGHDAGTERAVVLAELVKIVRLRLAKAFA